MLGRMAHTAARYPKRLDPVGPRAVVVIGDANGADLACVPKDASGLRRKAQVGRLVLEHEN